MSRHPCRLNKESSDDGVQTKRFAQSPESGQGSRMGLREAWNRTDGAVQRVSHHFSVWPVVGAFVVAASGAVAFLTAKATPVISAFAPFSYLIAILIGLIVAALAVGSVTLAFRLLFRREPHTEPPPIDPIPHEGRKGAPAAPPEAADVTEAKLWLGKFVINEFSPAINYVRAVLDSAEGMLQAWDANSPQAYFARLGVLAESPRNPTAFADIARIRASTLEYLEMHTAEHIGFYMQAVRRLYEVVEMTNSDPAKQHLGDLPEKFNEWFPMHQNFVNEFATIIKDIHFPRLRAEWNMKVHNHNDSYCATFAAAGFC